MFFIFTSITENTLHTENTLQPEYLVDAGNSRSKIPKEGCRNL